MWTLILCYTGVYAAKSFFHIPVNTVRDALQTLRDGVPTQKYPV